MLLIHAQRLATQRGLELWWDKKLRLWTISGRHGLVSDFPTDYIPSNVLKEISQEMLIERFFGNLPVLKNP